MLKKLVLYSTLLTIALHASALFAFDPNPMIGSMMPGGCGSGPRPLYGSGIESVSYPAQPQIVCVVRNHNDVPVWVLNFGFRLFINNGAVVEIPPAAINGSNLVLPHQELVIQGPLNNNPSVVATECMVNIRF